MTGTAPVLLGCSEVNFKCFMVNTTEAVLSPGEVDLELPRLLCEFKASFYCFNFKDSLNYSICHHSLLLKIFFQIPQLFGRRTSACNGDWYLRSNNLFVDLELTFPPAKRQLSHQPVTRAICMSLWPEFQISVSKEDSRGSKEEN